MYGAKERFFSKWFREHIDRAGTHNLRLDSCVGVCRNENDRDSAVLARQSALQVGAGQSRHLHIENQARCVRQGRRVQEFLC
jgi:hypothetical protein